MADSKPDFSALNAIEEELLVAKLKAVRKSITHAGEKGRALEYEVSSLLRSILPAEYGIATGFVAYHSEEGPRLSPQLDVIIYDALRGGPLISLDTCDVLPIEVVYGYVEVKATLRSTSDDAEEAADDSIERCIERNAQIRAMRRRRFWAPAGGSPVVIELREFEWLSPRSYVFAFEPVGVVTRDLDQLSQRAANVLKRVGSPAHLHGVFVANHGFMYTRPVDVAKATEKDFFHVRYTNDHPLLEFKTHLLRALASFPRPQQDWAPAIDAYYQHVVDWNEKAPKI